MPDNDDYLPITGALNITQTPTTARGTAITRANFAGYHLMAAISFAHQAQQIEEQAKGLVSSDPAAPIRWHCSSAIIMAATALEARINEIIQDIIDDKSSPEETRKTAERLISRRLKRPKTPDRQSEIAFKYHTVAELKGKNPAEMPADDAMEVLVSFRHKLVHFRPQWGNEDRSHKELERQLKGRFAAQVAIDFPYSHLTYDAAKWAVATVRGFSSEIAEFIGVDDGFAEDWLRFDLP